jgi:hypothetical protein
MLHIYHLMQSSFPSFFLLDEIELLHPEVSYTLHAGYQSSALRLRPLEAIDLQHNLSVGAGAYTPKDIS